MVNNSTNSQNVSGTIATPNVQTPIPLTGKDVTINNATTASSITVASSSTDTPTTPSSVTSPPTSDTEITDMFKDIFTNTTTTILFWISSAYIVYRLGSTILAPRALSAESSGQLTYSRTIDFILATLFVVTVVASYYKMPNSDQTNMFGWFLMWSYQFFNNPWSVLELFWFTVIFFILVYILRVPMAPDVKPVLVGLVEHKIWIFYASFAIIFFFKYLLNIPIVDIVLNNSVVRYFEDLGSAPATAPATSAPSGLESDWDSVKQDVDGEIYGTAPAPSTTKPTPSTIPPTTDKQVFNVGNNIYTYEEAQKVCKVFDASLASYDQIESAYNDGGEWCNYGWSADQMAFFPTQKSTWNKLQYSEQTKNSCGRPGINGGYFSNPYIRFGANCYGVKPARPKGWEPSSSNTLLQNANTTPPESDETKKLRQQAEINSFNTSEWSRYSNGVLQKSVTTPATSVTKPAASVTTPATSVTTPVAVLK